MNNDDAKKKIRKAASEGKIKFSSQDGINSFPDSLVEEMLTAIGKPNAWISDLSDLWDFAGFGSPDPKQEIADMQKALSDHFKVEVKETNFVKILREINVNRTLQ